MEKFLLLKHTTSALINDRFFDQSQEFSSLPLDVYVLRKSEVEFVNGTAAHAPHSTFQFYVETNYTAQ